jgi:hypothetical protein
MIGTINNWVSKVVGTVSGPFYGKSAKPSAKKVVKAKKVKCSHKGKCKCN